MINKQIKNISIVFLLTIFLIITAFIPAFNAIKTNSDKVIDRKGNILSASCKISTIAPTSFKSNKNFIGLSTILENNNLENIVVADESYNEYKPSMIVSEGNMLVGYECEYENKTFITFKKSSDYGQNWIDVNSYSNDNYNFTDLSLTNLLSGQGFGFGTFLTPENTSYVFELLISSFSNTGLWYVNVWDYSSNITDNQGNEVGKFFNIRGTDTIYFDNPNIPWIVGTIGDSEFIEGYEDYNGQNMPVFFHQDPSDPTGTRTIIFFPEVSGCSNISISAGENSYGTSMVYGVCEIANGTNNNLLFFHGNPDIWSEEDLLRKQYINSSEDLKHPEIQVDDNDIYISVETNSSGIVLYHSSNYGNSWDVLDITSDFPSVQNPMYPVLRQNYNQLFCSFIDNGNLSVTSTYKSNIHWSEPIQVNDVSGSVEPGYQFHDIYDNTRIIWSDNRTGNLDIYYHLSYVPSTDLALVDFQLVKENDMRLIPTKSYISITVENLGDKPAQDISINVTYKIKGSDEEYPINRIIYIDYLGPYQKTTIKRPLFRNRLNEFFQALKDFAGMESMTVYIDPENNVGDTDISNNFITRDDISFKSIFPILDLIEFIFRFL